jgi:threonine/homoserine/homoserine lactone efflux protein
VVILGTVVNVMFSSADVVVVLLADRVSAGLGRSARAMTVARRIGGAILVGLGLRVALSRA